MTVVLVCGTWDQGPGYPRARALVAALEQAGCRVVECRVPPPFAGAAKRGLAASPWRWPAAVVRGRRSRSALRGAVRRAGAELRPDLAVVPYPGHQAVRWVRSRFAGPIVLDLFLSAYDTAVLDRGLLRPGSLAARLLAVLDRRACKCADLVLLDTPQHARHVAELVGLPDVRFSWLPVSDPDAPEQPAPYRPPGSGEPLEVLFFGTGVPLHGLHHLLEAVGHARGVRLRLLGGSAEDRRRAACDPAVEVGPEFVERAELARWLERCHLVAGIFGDGAKAGRVVPFKVVHGLAAGRPVLTADTPAVRELLRPGVDCAVCPAADPVALADELTALAATPDRLASLARVGRKRYLESFSTAALAARWRRILADVGVRPARGGRESAEEAVS